MPCPDLDALIMCSVDWQRTAVINTPLSDNVPLPSRATPTASRSPLSKSVLPQGHRLSTTLTQGFVVATRTHALRASISPRFQRPNSYREPGNANLPLPSCLEPIHTKSGNDTTLDLKAKMADSTPARSAVAVDFLEGKTCTS